MKELILLKLGEIILKGQNRYRFEELLIKNIKIAVKHLGKATIISAQSTIYVSFEDRDADISAAVDALKKVFGIISLARAFAGPINFEELKPCAQAYLKHRLASGSTFKVIARRADKNYALTSPQICTLLGEYLLGQNPHLTVDLYNPDVTVFAEVREGHVYIHADHEKGAGGLPSGTGGHALLMLSGGIDSPVAGYMMAKRGLKITAIHFESPPYTSERAKEKVIELKNILERYTIETDLYIVPFTQIQTLIKNNCRQDLFTVIMRRIMLKIACITAEEISAKAIITGESLGQVASQTLGALCCTNIVSDRPVFRPLIGTDKQDIINLARNIGTFDTSILPYEDCCTVFTPKHPKTNPSISEVEEEEKKLDIETIIKNLIIEKI